jgi:hypothetical protein
MRADNPYGNGIVLNNSTLPSGGIKADNFYGNSNAPVDVNNSAWTPMTNSGLFNNSNRSISPESNQYTSLDNSLWPTAISAASSVIGDIAGLRNTRKNMPSNVSLPRIAPSNVSLEPQRNALQRSYNTASNVALRNSRDVSSPANAYANQIAGISALTDSLGTQMGQSYMNEANTNAQMNQQTNIKNAEIGSQEALQNIQLQGNKVNTENQYINSLSQTIPSALRDYRQQVDQTNMINTMGLNYGVYQKYNPNMNSWQRFVQGLQGNKYSVLNKNNPNIRG